MSPDLIAFLKAWYDWATNGAPDGEPFLRRGGLCSNLSKMVDHDKRYSVERELEHLLGADGGYPFGRNDYRTRRAFGTQHECPKRLAWVRERLIEAGELAA